MNIKTGVITVISVCCFCWMSGCNDTANDSGDRLIPNTVESKSDNIDVAIRSRDNANNIPEHRQETNRSSNSNGNNRNSNDCYDYSDDILSKGDVLDLYTNSNSKHGSYFVYQGRSDNIKREKIAQIIFWSIITCIIGVITGIGIALNNNRKFKQLIKEADRKIDINDLKSIIK
jgi:hypothetical protein